METGIKIMLMALFFLIFFSLSMQAQVNEADQAKTPDKGHQSQVKSRKKYNPYINMIEYFVCTRKLDKRPIWIEELKPKGCIVWYSKYKGGGPAARSSLGTEYCFQMSQRIRSNLESAHFKCVRKPKIIM
jgi:hypothetical protein